jgi:hypothetical protein
MPSGVYTRSEEQNQKTAIATRKAWANPEMRERWVKSHQGHILTEAHKKAISNALKANPNKPWLGKKQPPMVEKRIAPLRGRKRAPFTKEHIEKLRQSHIGLKYPSHSGENHEGWKGGITKSASNADRKTPEYKAWRRAVFARDGHSCVLCGTKGEIQADHIKSYAQFPELRFELSNGRTLCVPCHKGTDSYAVNLKKI